MKKMTLLGVLLVLLTGCVTTPVPPPFGAITTERPILTVGSKFLFYRTDFIGEKSRYYYVWTIQSIESYNKKSVYRISITDGDRLDNIGKEESCVLYDLDFNAVARTKDSREIRSASPCIQTFSWPLFVGKRWVACYDFFDIEKGRRWEGMRDSVKVESFEEIKVPAGTFQVFKIKRVGSNGDNVYIDYYAPVIKMVVKQETIKPGERWVAELVRYYIPMPR